MTQTAATALRISMPDIALLAKVKRPVVSMWRTRCADSDRPFPPALESSRGQEIFDASEVAEWLADTGRGNNPTASEDVAAFATVAEASHRDDRAVFDALTALLCLAVITGRRLASLDREEILDLADQHDPDDEFMFSELDSIRDRLDVVTTYAGLLADAAISPQEAFEKLMSDRFRSGLAEQTTGYLSPEAQSLVAKIALSLAKAGEAAPVFADPSPGSSDLLISVLREHGDQGPLEIITPFGPESAARLARRRFRTHDIYRELLDLDEDGVFGLKGLVTLIAQFPTPSALAMTDAEILNSIENFVLQMDDDQRGVVIGPATALSDTCADHKADEIRDSLLRMGNVRSIVRLPKGLLPSRSRTSLALWVLGAAHRDVDATDRFTMVADLTTMSLGDDVVESLVTDLTAASGGSASVRAHTFSFARPVFTRVLIATKQNLVSASPQKSYFGSVDPVELKLRVDKAIADLNSAVPLPLKISAMVAANSASRPQGPTTIGAMLADRRARAYPGHRFDENDFGSGNGVRVIGVPELIEETHDGSRVIDTLVLAGKYDAANLTEPGDVVFCTSPRPAAKVDREGSSVVAFPARVLRIDRADPGGLHGDLLAADINALHAGDREWKRWATRRVEDDQSRALTVAIDEMRRAREETANRLTSIDALTELITEGITCGSLDLPSESETTKGS